MKKIICLVITLLTTLPADATEYSFPHSQFAHGVDAGFFMGS